MGGYIIKRTLFAIPTLIGVTIGIFLMVRLLPGDIIDILFGGDLSASEEVKDRAREQLGLNGSYSGAVLALDQRCRPGRLRRLAPQHRARLGRSSSTLFRSRSN